MLCAPALIGIFWGAPLITRELETGTNRLAWTQSITRARWLAVKLALAGLASMATAGLFSLMVTWWSSPIDRVSMNSLAPATFDARGITPVGYAVFAFALGVTAGALIRRTLPAMAVTLAIFAAIQGYAMPQLVRPHLIPPAHASTALDIATLISVGSQNGQLIMSGPANIPGAWIYSSEITLPSGQPVSTKPSGACGNRDSSFNACQNYIASLHLRQQVTYQPASRYWALQWAETGVFLAAALLLACSCSWWVRRSSTA
ncbi:MAG: hypothetical protein JWM19_4920 [Actinomycetia bacterium]|nr:hypothetical protein [Actinomycetes bacterium]